VLSYNPHVRVLVKKNYALLARMPVGMLMLCVGIQGSTVMPALVALGVSAMAGNVGGGILFFCICLERFTCIYHIRGVRVFV